MLKITNSRNALVAGGYFFIAIIIHRWYTILKHERRMQGTKILAKIFMKEKKCIWPIVSIVSLVFITVFAVIIMNPLLLEKIMGKSIQKAGEKSPLDGYTYAHETLYVGDPQLSIDLFTIPFKKSDNYISNIELSKKWGKEGLQKLADLTAKTGEKAFNLSHSEITPKEEDPSDFVSCMEGIVAENEISMESTFITDKSLVYYDGMNVIVRGQLIYTVYEAKDTKALAELLGEESIEIGTEYESIIEMYLLPGKDNIDFKNYKLMGLTPLEKPTE